MDGVKQGTSEIGVAAFSTRAARVQTVDLQTAKRVRSASVIKPLLAWTAATLPPFVENTGEWLTLARPAITSSDNAAMAALWSRAGGDRLVASLNDRVAVQWSVAGHGEHPALRLMVTAQELAGAYGALALSPCGVSAQIGQWMREVPEIQTFGLRPVVTYTLGVDEASVGIKCGWFGGERAHAVVVVDMPDHTVGAVVTTSGTPDLTVLATIGEAVGNDARLAALHDTLAGPTIRSAVEQALLAGYEL